MIIELDGVNYNVIVSKKSNKNTYIRIDNDLNILVTTSLKMSIKEVEKIIFKNKTKILKLIEKKEQFREEDNVCYYKGKRYDVIFISNYQDVLIEGSKIYAPSFKKLHIWYDGAMQEYFKFLLDECYKLYEEKIPFPTLKIRKMSSRWGVCNRKNNSVTLNSQLMMYDVEIIKYVIIHELCHFIHFNHSKSFWESVEKYCPNYKLLRKMLKN